KAVDDRSRFVCESRVLRDRFIVFRPQQRETEVIGFETEPSMAEVERILEGPLEQVPGFLSIEVGGVVRQCVAFGSLASKQGDRPLNVTATIMWDSALRRDMGIGLIRR